MSQPDQYFPAFNFTDFQTDNPSSPLPAAELDGELQNISISINEIVANLGLIQRDDGALQNGVVTASALDPSIDPSNAVASAAIASAAATACQNILSSVISQWCGTAGGNSSAITLTPGNPISANAAGQKFRFLWNFAANAGNVTCSVSGKGALSMVPAMDTEIATSTPPGFFQTGIEYEITNNGLGYFQLNSVRRNCRSKDVFGTDLSGDLMNGDIADYYKTGNVASLTLGDGKRVTLRIKSGCTFVNGSNLVLPSGANIIAQPGDFFTFRGYPASVVVLESYNLASGAALTTPQGYRNGLINGDMQFCTRQIDGSGSFTSVSGLVQTLDGWFGWIAGAGGNSTHSQQAGGASSDGVSYKNVLRIQRVAANSAVNQLLAAQIIPSVDVIEKFAGRVCTVSFNARAGADFSAASGNMNILCSSGTVADEGSASLLAGTWTGQAFPLNVTQALPLGGGLVRYTTAPFLVAAAAKELEVSVGFTPVGTAGAADYIDVTGIQLEVLGPTPFESLPGDVALRRCKRFVRKTFPRTVTPAQNGGVTGALALVSAAATTFGANFDYDVPMYKAAPSATTYNPSAANANWRDTTNAGDKTVTVAEVGPDRIVITGASGAVGATNRLHYLIDGAL